MCMYQQSHHMSTLSMTTTCPCQYETVCQHILEQLQNSQDNVVDVAEPRGFGFLGMMESPCPVDGDVCRLLVQLDSTSCRNTNNWLCISQSSSLLMSHGNIYQLYSQGFQKGLYRSRHAHKPAHTHSVCVYICTV